MRIQEFVPPPTLPQPRATEQSAKASETSIAGGHAVPILARFASFTRNIAGKAKRAVLPIRTDLSTGYEKDGKPTYNEEQPGQHVDEAA